MILNYRFYQETSFRNIFSQEQLEKNAFLMSSKKNTIAVFFAYFFLHLFLHMSFKFHLNI